MEFEYFISVTNTLNDLYILSVIEQPNLNILPSYRKRTKLIHSRWWQVFLVILSTTTVSIKYE